jgi:flagellin-like hook-associated protein FlgL
MSLLDISLSAGMRANLLSLTGISAKIDRVQERLSTGKKVNSALDNPTNYFAAVAHQQRASDLNSRKDGIKEAIQVIRTADIGMNAMTSVFKQASAIADTAKGAASQAELIQLADQFNEMRNQVDQLTADSGYRGTNLLRRQDLNIQLSDNNTITIQGTDATSSGFDNMTNGLNVELASMDPLNIVDPNYVTTSGGSIKQDGQLTITNNDVPGIDLWLGDIGIKNQIITSQDVTLTTSTNLSDGRTVQSQLLDNVGVAEYGTGGFSVYRDTSVSAAVTTGSGSVLNSNVLQVADVSKFIGPLLSAGTQPFTLERFLTQSNAAIVSGTASVSSTTVNNPADVLATLGPLAGSGSQAIELSRAMTADAAVVGNPTAGVTTVIQNGSGVADLLGALSGSGTQSFQLSRDMTTSATVTSPTGSVTLANDSPSDIAQFIGTSSDNASNAFILTNTPPWSSSNGAILNQTASAISIDLAGNGTSITANLGGTWSVGDSITITTTASSWKSSNPAVTVVASGKDLNLSINGNSSTDIKVSLAALQKADAVIGVNANISNWQTNNPSVAIAATGTTLNLDFSNNGTTDVTVELGALTKADVKLSTTSFLSSWFSSAYPAITVNPAAGNTLDINLKTDAADVTNDISLTLSSLLYGDAKLTVTPESSIWKTTDPSISLNQPTGSGAMTADLNGDGINDIQIDLPTGGANGAAWLSTETVQAATTGPFSTTDSSVTLKYDNDLKTVGLILAGGGGTDITINLADSWAVNNLPTSPLGNGDNINLTVDGRHRWVKGDGVTPNAPGMALSMSEIDDAINTLRLYSAQNSSSLSILTVRDNFIENLVNVLVTGSDKLTLADMNEEGATMLMLQTRQNLGVTSLNLASQASQSVMRLF